MKVRCFTEWHSSYELEGDFSVGLIKVLGFKKTNPLESNFEGIGCFVRHSDLRARFWCVYAHEDVLWLVIGADSYRVGDLLISLSENFFTLVFSVHCSGQVKDYTVFQPWITKPWIALDVVSYDGIDHEMESFPAYLGFYLKKAEWRNHHWPHLGKSS